MKGNILGVVLFLCVASIVHTEPTVWYVHPDSALHSIQTALDSCSDNDIVLVGPGTYYENIIWPNTQGIHLISEMGPETTIIDGSNPSNPDYGSVIAFVSGQDTNSVLHGFTLTGGSGTLDPGMGFLGGGILCDIASPTIMGNIIFASTADFGGGIECQYYSSPVVTGNTIRGNAGDAGGGIECYASSSPHIEGNTIENNTSSSNGAGIQVYDQCSPYIVDNAIINNTAGSWGGGIRVGMTSSPTIVGNLINDNEAPVGGGIECDVNSSPMISDCTISNNNGDGISCVSGSNPIISNNNIFDNSPYGVRNSNPSITIDAEDNWWGDATGPYHPDSNPGGSGDTVSDYVDFTPWLTEPVGVEEKDIIKVARQGSNATIFAGPLRLPEGKNCRIFDITGRVVKLNEVTPGIYFIEIDGRVTQKVVKIR